MTTSTPSAEAAARGPIAAVVVAAGVGARAMGPSDAAAPAKQYRPIAGRSALLRSIEALAASPLVDSVTVAIRPEHARAYAAEVARLQPSLAQKLRPAVHGGAERRDSVAAALDALETYAPALALIHDAARPFLPQAVIARLVDALDHAELDGVCAGLPVVDTLRRATPDGTILETLDRSGVWRAQTPQAFRFEPLLRAYRAGLAEGATDDAEVARRAGLRVRMALGAASLRKITHPDDFAAAEREAKTWDAKTWDAKTSEATTMTMEPRIGTGFDVHRFGPNADGTNDHVMLCGVRVPHEAGLVGHSDADVGLHALTDALLGALALGDIGRHFPPSDPQWRGAASDQFLAHAAALARAAGARITQLDVTLICERPKIGPHAPAMRARIAEICGVPPARVSVKATTTEGLGFTGRSEGVAALASAALLAPPLSEDAP